MRTSSSRVFGQRQGITSTPVVASTPKAPLRSQPKQHTADELKVIANDRRKYRRIKVRLSGRFMRRDQSEYPCYTNDISAGGMDISAAVKCEVGEYVVFYLEEIGRVEGFVVRNHDDGFAIAIKATPHKREKLVASLTWLLNRHELEGSEGRRHERQVPSKPLTTLVRADGSKLQAKVLDLSIGGARINVKASLKTGEKVYLGKSSGFVIRAETDDIGIQFDTEQSPFAMHSYFS